MEQDPYTLAIFRTVVPASQPAVPLASAPEPDFDLDSALFCPHCGGQDAVKEMVDDACVAKCPCGCEFSPLKESVARRTLLRLAERRRRQHCLLDQTYEEKIIA